MNTPDKILVWDLPVRVFHALLALSFFGAFITAESERWARVHIALGYTVAGLVAFRLLWGLLGTRTARFASFVRSPRAAWSYLKSLLGPRPQHHLGHNPAGGWAIVGLLGLALATTLSGWLQFNNLGPNWLEDLHEGAANTMMGLVVLHIAAVAFSAWRHRDGLVQAMVTGRKPGRPGDAGIGRAWRPLGVLLLAGVLGFWGWEWSHPPAPLDSAQAPPLRHDKDDE